MFDGFCRHALISGKNKDVLFQKIVDRLEAGAAEYGDDSFRRDHAELLREIEEEAFDIFGWMFIYIQSVGVTSWDLFFQRHTDTAECLLSGGAAGLKLWLMFQSYPGLFDPANSFRDQITEQKTRVLPGQSNNLKK